MRYHKDPDYVYDDLAYEEADKKLAKNSSGYSNFLRTRDGQVFNLLLPFYGEGSCTEDFDMDDGGGGIF